MTKFSLLHSLTETTLSALNLFALEKTQLPFSELVYIFQQQSTARVAQPNLIANYFTRKSISLIVIAVGELALKVNFAHNRGAAASGPPPARLWTQTKNMGLWF